MRRPQNGGGADVHPRAAAGVSLRRKGFLIVALPAVFQLILLAGLFAMERAHDRERQAELRRREVISFTYRLRSLLVDTETAMHGYLLTDKAEFLQPYDRAIKEIPQQLNGLRALAKGDSASGQLDEIATRAASSLAFQTETLELIRSGGRDRAIDRVRQGLGNARMDAFRVSIRRFSDDKRREAESDKQRALALRSRLNAGLAAGTAADILICVWLILFFTGKFTRRLATVVENTRRIERQQTLPPPLGGDDEIGDLDRRVHDMAAALERADEQSTRAEEDLNGFFTVSLEMLCIAGFDGYFKRLNPAWEKTLGYSTQELCSRPWLDFVHPDDVEKTIAEAQHLAEGQLTFRFENRYRCADGSYRWLSWNAAALLERGVIYAAARDITERIGFERTLQDRNAALEVANRDLESFSYSVSHDLRSPLRAVDGYARILEEEYAAALDDEGRRLLDVIRSEARRMGVLIDDLLAFSRLGRQPLSQVDVDLGEISDEIVAEKRRRYPKREIEFVRGVAPPARADRSAIRQVLFNFMANAVKYAKPEGTIHIEFGGRSNGGQNLYWIRDQGIGFDMRYAEKIFGVFQRLHTDREFEGTGVGLAIVQRIINRHGGRVWAEGEPGKGAVFFFTLPTSEGEIQNLEIVNERSGNPAGRG